METYFIKLGGSVLTDTKNENVAKVGEIKRLLNEIKGAMRNKRFSLIIGHGSGSFAHVPARFYRTNEGLVDGNSRRGALITKIAANDLDRIIAFTGSELDMPLFPFSPSSFALSRKGRMVEGSVSNLKSAIDKGFIPLVYGDVMIDSEMGVSIASTEEVLRFLSGHITPSKVILGTDVDGVFESDPKRNPDAALIKKVDSSNIDSVMAGAAGAQKVDVTGGMQTKVRWLYDIAKDTGSVGYIANAGKPGMMKDILLGDDVDCTVVTA